MVKSDYHLSDVMLMMLHFYWHHLGESLPLPHSFSHSWLPCKHTQYIHSLHFNHLHKRLAGMNYTMWVILLMTQVTWKPDHHFRSQETRIISIPDPVAYHFNPRSCDLPVSIPDPVTYQCHGVSNQDVLLATTDHQSAQWWHMGSWDSQNWPNQNMQRSNIAHNLVSSLLATLFLSIELTKLCNIFGKFQSFYVTACTNFHTINICASKLLWLPHLNTANMMLTMMAMSAPKQQTWLLPNCCSTASYPCPMHDAWWGTSRIFIWAHPHSHHGSTHTCGSPLASSHLMSWSTTGSTHWCTMDRSMSKFNAGCMAYHKLENWPTPISKPF